MTHFPSANSQVSRPEYAPMLGPNHSRNRFNARAVIRRDGQQIFVEPRDLPALARLTTVRAQESTHEDGRLRLVRQPQSLLDPDPPRTNAGLSLIVVDVLAQSGFEVIRRTTTPISPLSAPVMGELPHNRPIDAGVLDFVHHNDRGIIRCYAGVAYAWLIAQMNVAWPDRTFAIATATNDEACRLRRALYKLGIKSTLVTRRYCSDHPRRVVIGTYTAMAHPQIECNKRDVFIAANAVHALGENAQRCLLQADAGFRLFGFLPNNRQLSPWEQDWLMATFSPETITIPAHGYEEITPGVVWVPFRWNGKDAQTYSTLTAKRELVWQHHVRNRWIAKLAKNLVTSDAVTFTSEDNNVVIAPPDDHSRRVIVLVDGVEHALAIADRLPGWPIITADTNEQYLTRQQRRILIERRNLWNTGTNMIVTTTGADSVDISGNGTTTVVIWASSGPHLPPLPPAWRAVAAGEARDLLVVDVQDRGHGNLAAWARRRKKAYEQTEWLPPGTNPLVARIRRFLKNRPRRAAR